MVCRVCLTAMSAAVICAQCSLILHSKCTVNAPPCNLRIQHLSHAQDAEKGNPGSEYSNPMNILNDACPTAPIPDNAYITSNPGTSHDTPPPLPPKPMAALKQSRTGSSPKPGQPSSSPSSSAQVNVQNGSRRGKSALSKAMVPSPLSDMQYSMIATERVSGRYSPSNSRASKDTPHPQPPPSPVCSRKPTATLTQAPSGSSPRPGQRLLSSSSAQGNAQHGMQQGKSVLCKDMLDSSPSDMLCSATTTESVSGPYSVPNTKANQDTPPQPPPSPMRSSEPTAAPRRLRSSSSSRPAQPSLSPPLARGNAQNDMRRGMSVLSQAMVRSRRPMAALRRSRSNLSPRPGRWSLSSSAQGNGQKGMQQGEPVLDKDILDSSPSDMRSATTTESISGRYSASYTRASQGTPPPQPMTTPRQLRSGSSSRPGRRSLSSSSARGNAQNEKRRGKYIYVLSQDMVRSRKPTAAPRRSLSSSSPIPGQPSLSSSLAPGKTQNGMRRVKYMATVRSRRPTATLRRSRSSSSARPGRWSLSSSSAQGNAQKWMQKGDPVLDKDILDSSPSDMLCSATTTESVSGRHSVPNIRASQGTPPPQPPPKPTTTLKLSQSGSSPRPGQLSSSSSSSAQVKLQNEIRRGKSASRKAMVPSPLPDKQCSVTVTESVSSPYSASDNNTSKNAPLPQPPASPRRSTKPTSGASPRPEQPSPSSSSAQGNSENVMQQGRSVQRKGLKERENKSSQCTMQ